MKKVRLIPIYCREMLQYDVNIGYLYQLLAERTPEESISHKFMPSKEEHIKFVDSNPYKSWYLIHSMEESNYGVVGAIYINYDNSIGIGIFNKYKRQGYASAAIKALMDFHKEPYYFANINPKNTKSKELFMKLGFKHTSDLRSPDRPFDVIQETYAINCDGALKV